MAASVFRLQTIDWLVDWLKRELKHELNDRLAETRKKSLCHHLQNYFYHRNNSNKRLEFSLFCHALFLILMFLLFLLSSYLNKPKKIRLINKPCFFYFCVKYFTRKFIIISCGELFSFNFWYFYTIIFFLDYITNVAYLILNNVKRNSSS